MLNTSWGTGQTSCLSCQGLLIVPPVCCSHTDTCCLYMTSPFFFLWNILSASLCSCHSVFVFIFIFSLISLPLCILLSVIGFTALCALCLCKSWMTIESRPGPWIQRRLPHFIHDMKVDINVNWFFVFICYHHLSDVIPVTCCRTRFCAMKWTTDSG